MRQPLFLYGKTVFFFPVLAGELVLVSLVLLGMMGTKFWTSERFKIKHLLMLFLQTGCSDIVAITSKVKFEGLHIFFSAKSNFSKIALPLDQDFRTRINLGIN